MYTANYLTKKTNPYLINQIKNSTPQELTLKVYDFAIQQCHKNDMIRTNEAIQVLINSLNFDDPAAREISTGLLRLYTFCQDQMRKKNNEIVLKILTELKQTWLDAIKNMG
ncbi:flagellar protein FliS [Melioribacter sp. OK-6-Me]|uniref:flagellar protein FliS n=1 Tax=unclassified Melioribacter TaxID=2627329 RepID=UPI003ED98647